MKIRPSIFHAFTLTELLISLAIIGLISAIATPTVFKAVESNNKKAKFKEAYSVLNHIVKKGVESGEMKHAGDFAYIKQQLNASKVCDDAGTGGCWPVSNLYGDAVSTESGMVMTSGTYIFGIATTGTPEADLYWIDVNGLKGPNERCRDQFPVAAAVQDTPFYGGSSNLEEGKVVLATVEKSFWWGCNANLFPTK